MRTGSKNEEVKNFPSGHIGEMYTNRFAMYTKFS